MQRLQISSTVLTWICVSQNSLVLWFRVRAGLARLSAVDGAKKAVSVTL